MDSVDNSVVEYMDIVERLFHSEFIRRKSLKFCKHDNINFNLDYAAELGFYFKPNCGDDTLICMHCTIAIGSWEPTDEIEKEHVKFSPNCVPTRFNIPKRYQYLTQYMIDCWFDMYYYGKFLSIEDLKTPTTRSVMYKFNTLWNIRKNDSVYQNGVFNDLVGLYSKDMLSEKNLTKEQIDEIYEILEYMESSFIPRKSCSIGTVY